MAYPMAAGAGAAPQVGRGEERGGSCLSSAPLVGSAAGDDAGGGLRFENAARGWLGAGADGFNKTQPSCGPLQRGAWGALRCEAAVIRRFVLLCSGGGERERERGAFARSCSYDRACCIPSCTLERVPAAHNAKALAFCGQLSHRRCENGQKNNPRAPRSKTPDRCGGKHAHPAPCSLVCYSGAAAAALSGGRATPKHSHPPTKQNKQKQTNQQKAQRYTDQSAVLHAGLARFFDSATFSDLTVIVPDGRRLRCHHRPCPWPCPARPGGRGRCWRGVGRWFAPPKGDDVSVGAAHHLHPPLLHLQRSYS